MTSCGRRPGCQRRIRQHSRSRKHLLRTSLIHGSSKMLRLASSATLRSRTSSRPTVSSTRLTTTSGSSFKPLKTPARSPFVSRTRPLRRTSPAERNPRTRRTRRVRMSGLERALDVVSVRRRVLYRRVVTCTARAEQRTRSVWEGQRAGSPEERREVGEPGRAHLGRPPEAAKDAAGELAASKADEDVAQLEARRRHVVAARVERAVKVGRVLWREEGLD